MEIVGFLEEIDERFYEDEKVFQGIEKRFHFHEENRRFIFNRMK